MPSPSLATKAHGERISIPTARCCARTWLSLVTSGVVAAALSATNFRSSLSAIMTKASGSTGPVNSPSGRNRSVTPQPIEARNPAQDCLGLTSGRLVPDQEKMSLPNGRENARGCASAVEARRDEYVGIDHNPVHADTVLRTIYVGRPRGSHEGRQLAPWTSWRSSHKLWPGIRRCRLTRRRAVNRLR
jgi:hypothetical protein